MTQITSVAAGIKPIPIDDFRKAFELEDVRRGSIQSVAERGSSSQIDSWDSRSIPAGRRNQGLTSLAGALRRRGLSQGEIEAALQVANNERCEEPLDDDEVAGIAASVSRYQPHATASIESFTDTGNANRFAARWGHMVRYVPQWRKWLTWDGKRWQPDLTGQVMEMAKRAASDIWLEGQSAPSEAERKQIEQWSIKSQNRARLDAMIELSQSIPTLLVPAEALDANLGVLNVENGTVDLRTGKLRPHDPADLITHMAPVCFDMKARCPEFHRFLNRVMDGESMVIRRVRRQHRVALTRYLRRAVGYALTGDTSAQCFFFLHGNGANGKSTFLDVIQALMGEGYSRSTQPETWMERPGGRAASNDLARLQGTRFVVTTEIDSKARWSESLMKQVTGGDRITARFLYGEFFDFVPRLKLFIAGNHKPVVTGTDDGIWRRMHLVPFTVTIPEPERDLKLAERLKKELPGILNWALKGCAEFQRTGLQPPDVVTAAVKEYREDMDIIGHWLEDHCKFEPTATTGAGAAYDSYRTWANVNGHKPMSSTAFGREMGSRKNRGIDRQRTSKGILYRGFRVVVSLHGLSGGQC